MTPPPASQKSIENLKAKINFHFPDSYLKLLGFSNGPAGSLSIDPGWFEIWEAEEVIELNKGYEIEEYIPGYWGFGSNGAGELLAFRIKEGEIEGIYMIPFIPL